MATRYAYRPHETEQPGACTWITQELPARRRDSRPHKHINSQLTISILQPLTIFHGISPLAQFPDLTSPSMQHRLNNEPRFEFSQGFRLSLGERIVLHHLPNHGEGHSYIMITSICNSDTFISGGEICLLIL